MKACITKKEKRWSLRMGEDLEGYHCECESKKESRVEGKKWRREGERKWEVGAE